eukprot:11872450-Karenia_brevis.AAC.1
MEGCEWTDFTIPNETHFDTELEAFSAGDVTVQTLSSQQQVARGWQRGSGSSSGGGGLAGGEGGGGVGGGAQQVARGWQQGSGSGCSGCGLAGGDGGEGLGGGHDSTIFSSQGPSLASDLNSRA